VKAIDFEALPGQLSGKRLLIAGTSAATATKAENIFFAVYNTHYNVTEYIWEDALPGREILRNVEVSPTQSQSTISSLSSST
jgi:hypothetical protein